MSENVSIVDSKNAALRIEGNFNSISIAIIVLIDLWSYTTAATKQVRLLHGFAMSQRRWVLACPSSRTPIHRLTIPFNRHAKLHLFSTKPMFVASEVLIVDCEPGTRNKLTTTKV